MRDSVLAALLDQLAGCESFEDAANLGLGAALEVAERHRAESRHADDSRLLRAVAHWRPQGSYRGVLVREPDHDTAEMAEGKEFLISTAAWQMISERGCSVAFDVETGRLQVGGGSSMRAGAAREVAGARTLSRLQRRGATHLFVSPLLGPGGVPVGMLSVEADCSPAIGQRFIWQEAGPELELLCKVISPYLVQLPTRRGGDAATDEFLPVVGPTMAPLLRLLRVFAQQDETLLLSGATGTGKSRMARWCHEQSRRRGRPFEVVDLQSIPDEMQIGELFGWQRGAFTGATSDHAGSVQRAEGGTLFIDEIDKLSTRAQAALLYLLEEHRYRVLGDGAERVSDLRFIVGTNTDLRCEVDEGRFREDLYYRINVLAMGLPGLDERPDELADWARYMLARRHEEMRQGGEVTLSAEGEALLMAAGWPGNLRQLDNVVRRAYVLALAECGDAGGGIEVGEEALRLSLLSESGRVAVGPSAPDPMRAAARFIADAACRNGTIDLDLLSGIRGLALIETIRECGSKEEAFRLLGRETLVAGRNHHKALQRELERATELCRALGIEVDEDVLEGGRKR